MTNQTVKFYKFNNHETSASKITTAKAVEGAIIYIVDLHELWIGGENPKLVIKGASEVTYSNSILTVSNYQANGEVTTQTLDFSDVASAQATLKVFDHVYNLMGTTASGSTQTLDYSDGYALNSTIGTLVAADKALDQAIHNIAESNISDVQVNGTTIVNNHVANLNAVDGYNATTNGLATVNTVTGAIESLDVATDKGGASISGSTITINAVQEEDGLIKDGGSTTIELADDYNASTNKIATENSVKGAIEALDTNADVQAVEYTAASGNDGAKLTFKGVSEADGIIAQGSGATELQFAKVATTGAAADVSIADAGGLITAETVEGALQELAGNINNAVTDVKINNTSIISDHVANFGVVADYDATNNKIATVNSVNGAINSAIGELNATATIASVSDGVVSIYKTVNEVSGEIADGSETIDLAKVATTGAAADISIADAGSLITANTVEGALQELASNIAAAAGGMRYNGDIANTTATLNGSTNDIRPGDIYLASASFTIGTTSVEPGDMIIYKGDTSTSTVTLTSSNCSIIERETDVMVTAGDTLSDNYLVFGNGNKEVSVNATVGGVDYQVSASDLKSAIDNAGTALQSISKGTDGTYVTTTVGSKDGNNDQSVGVAVTTSTVTYNSETKTINATDGLMTSDAVTPIMTYVDNKVGTAVQSVTEGTNVNPNDGFVIVNAVVGGTSTDPTIHTETTVNYGSSTISGSDITITDGIAKMSTVNTLIGQVVSTLDADITSDDAAVATVEVVETDGKISDVVVTTQAANVVYNATAGTLTATSDTGAVTGADIAAIKNYIDAGAATVVNANAVIGVNDTNTTTIATIDGTDITVKATLNWEDYE